MGNVTDITSGSVYNEKEQQLFDDLNDIIYQYQETLTLASALGVMSLVETDLKLSCRRKPNEK
jgi:hypothetical protein